MSEQAEAANNDKRPKAGRAVFLKASVFDFLFVLIASTALVMTVSFGFESAPQLRSNPLVCAGIAVPLLLVLFAGSWSKRAVVPSALGTAVCAIAIVCLLTALSGDGKGAANTSITDDVASNCFVFALVAVVVPVVVFLLSRRQAGSVFLLFAAGISCGTVQFLYRDWSSQNGVLISLIAIAGVVALLIFQGYRSSIYAAKRLKKTSFGAAALVSAGVAAVGVAVGAAIFFLLISGLGIHTPQIKPFKDYFIRPVVEYSANYTRQPVDDPNAKSSKLSENKSTTRQNAPGSSQGKSTDQKENDQKQNESEAGSKLSFDRNNWNQNFQDINYSQMALTALPFILLIVAATVAVVLLWRRRRVLRLQKIAGQSPPYYIWYLYEFLCDRFKRVGIERAENLTFMEFAMASRSIMQPYLQGSDTDFLQVTLAYQRACFDGDRVSEEDCAVLKRAYWAFYKNARSQCGFFKWVFWRFWRL